MHVTEQQIEESALSADVTEVQILSADVAPTSQHAYAELSLVPNTFVFAYEQCLSEQLWSQAFQRF